MVIFNGILLKIQNFLITLASEVREIFFATMYLIYQISTQKVEFLSLLTNSIALCIHCKCSVWQKQIGNRIAWLDNVILLIE